MDLLSYTLEELEPYLISLYSRPDAVLPISPLRLDSYLANPRAKKSDPVLFEMRREGEVIAYRTLLPDYFYDRKDQFHRFAWLSGNWVRPDMRRRGISTRLLEKAEQHWDGRLMYTNFAPQSKAVYDGTGRFRMIANRDRLRFHLRSAAGDLLSNRTSYTWVFGMADRLVNQFHERKLEKFRFPEGTPCKVKKIDGFIAQLSGFVGKLQQDSLFRRDREIFEWALEYPWVTELECDPLNYYFSYRANRFENTIYQLTPHDSDHPGVLWLLMHNNVLSVPYLFAEDHGLHACMAETILRTMIDTGCTHTTIGNPDLHKELLAYKKIFLSVRKMPQLIFAHKKLAPLIPEKMVIQDGDGDVMFTG